MDFKKLAKNLQIGDTIETNKSILQDGRFYLISKNEEKGEMVFETEDQGSNYTVKYSDKSNLLWLVTQLEQKGL